MNDPPKMVYRLKKRINDDLAQGVGRVKAIAFKAIPSVISRGRIVDYQMNWERRGYDTVVIVAPVNVKNLMKKMKNT